MKTTGELQYVADTLLIERLARMGSIQKEAGIISDVMDSTANTIKTQVIDSVDTTSWPGFAKSVFRILEPMALLRIHPVFGIMSLAGQLVFGISLTDIISGIVSRLRSKIENAEKITPHEIDQTALSLVKGSSYNLLADLYLLEKNGMIEKEAIPSLFRRRYNYRNVGLWQKAFGKMGPRRTSTLLGGIAGWLVKTVLASVGLLVGGGLIKDVISPSKEEKPSVDKPPSRDVVLPQGVVPASLPATEPTSAVPAQRTHSLQPSGWGERYYKNEEGAVWLQPTHGDARKTLLSWTINVYPELHGYENEILNNSSFNSTANKLRQWIDPVRPKWIKIPNGIHTIKEIVDIFATDIARDIERSKQRNEYAAI